MRIALYTDSYTPYVSGVVRSVQRLTKGLTSLGHQVYIFAPSYSRKPTSQEACDAARVFRFFSVPAPNYPEFSISVPVSPRISSWIRKLGIQVIHSHSPFLMGNLGARLARRNNIPLIFTHHTLYHEYIHYIPAPARLSHQMVVRYLQRYCRRCDHIISPTPQVEQIISQLYTMITPVTSIPTGVDESLYQEAESDWLRNRLQLDETDRILLFVGRLGKEKNPGVLLKTLQLLANRYPQLHLVLVGDGPERNPLQKQSEQLGLTKQVHFTGTLNGRDVVNAYRSADIFLFGSVTETQGLVTLEAMAGGLPVVAVNATGTQDLVSNGVEGFLTDNDPLKLAEKVEVLLSNPSLYQQMRENALAKADEYSLENIARKHLAVYTEALEKKGTPRKAYLVRLPFPSKNKDKHPRI